MVKRGAHCPILKKEDCRARLCYTTRINLCHSSVESSAPTILRSRFKSQAQLLHFFQFIQFKLNICHLNWNLKRTKINQKRPGSGHFVEKTYSCIFRVFISDEQDVADILVREVVEEHELVVQDVFRVEQEPAIVATI